MKQILLFWAFFFTGILQVSIAKDAAAIELRVQGKSVVLAQRVQQQLEEEVRRLVESSNFHSGRGDKRRLFTLHGVQSEYRRTVAGSFLRIAFPTAQKFKTVGGDIRVSEIVVGLNRDDFASSLFTVDESGAIVGHSKYSGEQCIKIMKSVRRANP